MQHRPFFRSLLLPALAAALLTAGCASKVPLNKDSGATDNAAVDSSRQVAPVDTTGAGGSSVSENMGQAELAARTVYFDFDSYIVQPEFQALLQKNAAFIKADKNRQVKLEGHADLRGTREYNLALGARRAASTREYLASRGIPAGRIKTISYGKEKPVAVCDDISCWSQNRRAVTVLGGAGM